MQWRGGIYFVASEYDSVEQLRSDVVHETVAHFGIRTVVDEATKNRILDGIARDHPETLDRMGEQEFGEDFDANDPRQRRIAAEEALAYYAPMYLAGKPVPQGVRKWVQQFIEAIEAFLRRVSGRREQLNLPQRYSTEEIQRIIDAFVKHLRQGTRAAEAVE
jgi:hypothetical protein